MGIIYDSAVICDGSQTEEPEREEPTEEPPDEARLGSSHQPGCFMASGPNTTRFVGQEHTNTPWSGQDDGAGAAIICSFNLDYQTSVCYLE